MHQAGEVTMRTNEFDIIVGKNNHHGVSNYIGLGAAERERHVFVIGGTGNGKTYAIAVRYRARYSKQ